MQVNGTYREREGNIVNSPKTAMVLFANACSKPYAVMIELKDTFIAVMAVPGTRWLQKMLVAELEHWHFGITVLNK